MLRFNEEFKLTFEDTDTNPETQRQVLWAMRRTITEIGWCQRSWAKAGLRDVPVIHEDACKFCLGGALGFVLMDEDATSPPLLARVSPLALAIREVLRKTIQDIIPGTRFDEAVFPDALDVVVDWNDTEGRTLSDMQRLLDRTISSLPEPVLV